MIIDATGPIKPSKTIDISKLEAMEEVAEVSFLSKENPAFCVIIPSADKDGIDWVFEEPTLSESRMVVLVDDDIFIKDGRQVLWAIATRFQPADDSVIKDSRLLIDARKGGNWTALRATLPFEKRT